MAENRYVRCLKKNGKIMSGGFENFPAFNHIAFFWVEIPPDGNGDYILDTSPQSKYDRIKFKLTPALTQQEDDEKNLVKILADGEWKTTKDLQDHIDKIKKVIKKEARQIIQSSDRKVGRHRDQVADGMAEVDRALSDVDFDALIDERELTRSENKTFKTAVAALATVALVMSYSWSFTHSEHSEIE